MTQYEDILVEREDATFSGQHNSVSGQARMAHDQLLTRYLTTQEAHDVSQAFSEKPPPDADRFWR